jgi:hypothetical protein
MVASARTKTIPTRILSVGIGRAELIVVLVMLMSVVV